MDARGPSLIAAHVLSRDPQAALVELTTYLEGVDGPEADEARAAMDLAATLGHYDEPRPILDSARGFAAAVCTARMSTDLTPERALGGTAYDELIGFLDTENAMSSGQITMAEALALSRVDGSPGEIVFWAWAGVALSRSYCFQGRLDDARAARDRVLGSVNQGAGRS